MIFQFTIPIKTSDLLDPSVGDSYYVKQVYNVDEIPNQLKICFKELNNTENAFYIFDHFDTYFSVIENAERLSAKHLLRSYQFLYITSEKLEKNLDAFLNHNEVIEGVDRSSYLNLTQMVLFALVNTVKSIDQVILKAQSESGQVKKHKKVDVEGFEHQQWEQKRYDFLLQLNKILQLPLEKLWSPPIAEENFVNMICDICYRTLQILYANEKRVCDMTFKILGTAIKRYNHATAFPTQILQILRSDKVNAIQPIARGVHFLHEEFGIQSIFSILVEEVIDTLSGTTIPDALIAKNFTSFLTELTNIAPKLILPHISHIAEELLNMEPYLLRTGILQIIGDVILKELTSEDLSDELKESRDEFLEDLLNHVNDINANVRSKTLQIWMDLRSNNAVPLAIQHQVLRCAVERLEDKSILVRKNAVALIKLFIENNPFAAKLTLEELQKRYETEKEERERLRNIMIEAEKQNVELNAKWELIEPELKPVLEEIVKEQQNENNTSVTEDYDILKKKVTDYLIEKNYKEATKLLIKADLKSKPVEELDELKARLNTEELCIYFMELAKSYLCKTHELQNIAEQFDVQHNAVLFTEDCIEFSKIITEAIPKIKEMLLSKSNSDVLEAVNFFKTAHLFGIKETEKGVKDMLYLLWSGDKEKRDAIVNAYKDILFTTDLQGRAHALKVVENLSEFLESVTYGEYLALEILLQEWITNEVITPQMILILFERVTLKTEGITENKSRLALQLLITASSKKSSIATANTQIIKDIGLGERGLKDPRIFSGCLEFLLNTIQPDETSKFYKRYEPDDQIIETIINNFKKFFFYPKINNFDELGTKTIEFIYRFCQSPDIICGKLIIYFCNKIKEISINNSNKQAQQTQQQNSEENDSNEEIIQSQVPTQSTQHQKVGEIPTFLMTRFIFVIGYIIMKEMIFLDIDVYNNMKYREELKEMKDNMKKKVNKRRTAHLLNMSASGSLKRLSGSAAEPQQEPDEDLTGAVAEDNIAELINYICEEELLYSEHGIMQKLIPLVIEICKYPLKYNDNSLQQAATLCLIRFMSVSQKFCDTYMPFIMNILRQSTNIKIQCNIIVGVSDLTCRFPNTIEPWTGHIFSALHEKNDELRLTAVKMLCHLILNEMIRVKVQISDLAMCIVDKNEEISNHARQLFKELANKPNILYNVLPDIISRLSDKASKLDEDKFHTIMRYIFGLINKDRHIESLVEKLCLRFKLTYEERQWRDIAFCLSLLNYNEKSIKKLTNNISNFKDKVQVEEVYQSFKTIISNASKLAKQELKEAIQEFESRLNDCFQVKEKENNIEKDDSPRNKQQQQQQQQQQQRPTTSRRAPTRKNNKKKQIISSSEEESVSSASDSSDEEAPQIKRHNTNLKQQKLQRQQLNKNKVAQILQQESNSSETNSPVTKKSRSSRRK